MDDGILDALHRDLKQVGISSIGIMHIYLPSFGPIQPAELGGKVFSCRVVVARWALIIGEVFGDRLLGQFVFKEINLVEEQDDRRALEPRETHY